MVIEREDIGSVTVLSFVQEDQLHEPESLQEEIEKLLQENRNNILIDLEDVHYISSSVLGCMITTLRHLQTLNGSLKIVNVQPSVSNIFEITRINRHIEMFNDMEIAVTSFG